ncbi:BppU family phage baseplate upper protein [Bacillus altitudinis]|uniref:BppU family phage baseplate upper protein n=1 Tax=Bacillus altitudinis TaxID=293387 RepID=UPI002E20B5FF|nr:BppU family phage baseplate upper protein [Bacillus altitudinis]
MTNQLFKNGVLPFVVDAYDQSVYDSKIVFSTQDIGTAKLIFKLRKDGVPLPLSAVDGKLVLSFKNGSKNVRNITLIDKVEGIAEYVLDNDEIKLYGKVQASLNLYYRNGQALSIHEFTFDIQRNLIDQDIAPAAEFYIDDFQTLKTEIERMAAELETDIQKRTDDMQGNIDKITKELQEQLDHLKEKLGDLEALETKEGAKAKVDAALAVAKKYTDDHAIDQKIHVTEDKQKAWDAKETTSGAQTKANKALSDAKSYTDELSQKAQMYKLTTDSGFRQAVPTTIGGTNLFELPPGFYYGAGQYFTNLPTTNDTSWFNVDVFTTGIRKNFHVIRSADNTHWVGTIHTDGTFRGWKRILTVEDVANSTYVDTYDQDNSSVSAAENVATKLVFGATRADDLSEYNRSRAEITLKNSGLYLIRLYITSTNITVGSDNILSCYVNGTEFQRFGNWNPATSSSTCVLYLLQKFKAGDKVTFYITPRGTNKTVSINTAYVTMSQLR